MARVWYAAIMSRSPSFHSIRTAPLDGSLVEVVHGLRQEIAVAYWAFQQQGWIRDGDPSRRVLSWVTSWRPLQAFGRDVDRTRDVVDFNEE
jgi:hypothetical protein